jgi:hypothetical protein
MPVEVMSPISRRGGKPGSIHRGDQSEPQEVHVRPETHVHMEAPEQPEPGDQSEPEPRAAADADVSGQVGCADPAHLAEFEALFGRPIFRPNVAGSSLGVTGPDE